MYGQRVLCAHGWTIDQTTHNDQILVYFATESYGHDCVSIDLMMTCAVTPYWKVDIIIKLRAVERYTFQAPAADSKHSPCPKQRVWGKCVQWIVICIFFIKSLGDWISSILYLCWSSSVQFTKSVHMSSDESNWVVDSIGGRPMVDHSTTEI